MHEMTEIHLKIDFIHEKWHYRSDILDKLGPSDQEENNFQIGICSYRIDRKIKKYIFCIIFYI